MKKYNSLIGVIFSLFFLLPATAQAWEYFLSPPDFATELPIKWYEYDNDPATARVTVLVDDTGLADILGGDPDYGVTATINALHTWNYLAGEQLISAVASSLDTTIVNVMDAQPTLIFNDPLGACIGNCIALTFVTHYDMGDVDNGVAEIRSCNGRDYLPYFDVDIITNDNVNILTNQPYWNWTSVAEGGSCSNENYIEAVMTHEAGHLLGLGHEYDPYSLSAAPLMYSALGFCDNKTLQQDDLTGRDVIYNCAGSSSNPSQPTASFSSSSTGLTATFTDQSTSDNSITSWLWSFGDGNSSTQQSPIHSYASAGDYLVSLTVSNSNDTLTRTQTVVSGGSSGVSLSVTAYKMKGMQKADLLWSGGASEVDIWRDGVKIVINATISGEYTDNINVKGGGITYVYQVCDTGSTNCSNTSNAIF